MHILKPLWPMHGPEMFPAQMLTRSPDEDRLKNHVRPAGQVTVAFI
jgi:hypothetical protein